VLFIYTISSALAWCGGLHGMGGTRTLKLGATWGPGHRGAIEISVWGLWAKCRPGLELAGVGVRSFLSKNRL